jgi:hypothetical protein
VLYCEEENGFDELWRRINLICGDRASLVKESLHVVSNSGLKIDDEDFWLPPFFAFVEDIQPVLVLFDATSRFHRLDENSSREMAYLNEVAFKPLCKTRFDAATIALDHPPKDLPGQPRDLAQAVRGSGDKVAAADRLWYLTKAAQSQDTVTLHNPLARNGPEMESLTVRRVFEDDDSGMHHEVIGHGDKAAQAVATEADLDLIVAHIQSSPGQAVPRQELVDITSADRATRALGIGIATGTLVKVKDPEDRRKTLYKASSGLRLVDDEG